MGRGKIEIKKIENPTNRQVTFSKRRGGLLKKAHELGILCDVHVGLIVFSNSGKMFEYSNPSSSMKQIIERYQRATSTRIDDHSNEQDLYSEMTRIQHQNEKLHASIRQFTGEDLSALTLCDLDQLERQLEISVEKVRYRKNQLLHQQLENLRRKEHLLEDQNRQLTYMVQEQHGIGEPSSSSRVHGAHDMQAIEQFVFYPDEPKNMVQFHNLRLQPTQPDLQDPTLHGHGLQL